MSNPNTAKRANRIRRHNRVRARIDGNASRPRVVVFRSNQHINAQAVDDVTHRTLAFASDSVVKKGTKTERSLAAGKALAGALKALKIDAVVFDRGGFKYHGRVKAVAEGLREGGVKL